MVVVGGIIMKKIFNVIIICMCLFFITGCGKEKEPEKTEFTMGDTISIKNFDITFVCGHV